MFSLVVFSASLALAAAAPSVSHDVGILSAPVVHSVSTQTAVKSTVVGRVPTCFTYTSRSVITGQDIPALADPVETPVVKAAVVEAAPVVKAEVVEAVPIVKPAEVHSTPITVPAVPVVKSTVIGSVPSTITHTSSSVVHSAVLAAPVFNTYAAPDVAAPVVRAIEPVIAVQPVVLKSTVVGSIPTSVIHTSSSIVHAAAVSTPVVRVAPAVVHAAPALVHPVQV